MLREILWDLTSTLVNDLMEKVMILRYTQDHGEQSRTMKKLSLDHLGEGKRPSFSFRGYLASLIGSKQKRVSPLVSERKRFEGEVREQFLKLREKGLGIHVFTL